MTLRGFDGGFVRAGALQRRAFRENQFRGLTPSHRAVKLRGGDGELRARVLSPGRGFRENQFRGLTPSHREVKLRGFDGELRARVLSPAARFEAPVRWAGFRGEERWPGWIHRAVKLRGGDGGSGSETWFGSERIQSLAPKRKLIPTVNVRE